MRRILLVLLFAASAIHAREMDFESRVALGKESLLSPRGKSYAVSHVQRFRAIAVSCAKKGLPWPESFRIVADMSPAGRLENIASDTQTPFVQCVLEVLEADSFAAPPISPFALTIQFKRE
jgi:hypothetical protein